MGGIYFSADGGETWSQDLDSAGAELDACDSVQAGTTFQVWCAGYDGSFNGKVYSLKGTSAR